MEFVNAQCVEVRDSMAWYFVNAGDHRHAQQILKHMDSGEAAANPFLLSTVAVPVYADLKGHRFSFHPAYPVFVPKSPSAPLVSRRTPLKEVHSKPQIIDLYRQLTAVSPSYLPLLACIEDYSEEAEAYTAMGKVRSVADMLRSGTDFATRTDIAFVVFDTSRKPNALAWHLRYVASPVTRRALSSQSVIHCRSQKRDHISGSYLGN